MNKLKVIAVDFTKQTQHIEHRVGGVRYHQQNTGLSQPTFHQQEGPYLFQTKSSGLPPRSNGDLYGLNYTEQVLEKGIYRKWEHHNRPVMDENAQYFGLVEVTPENAAWNIVNSGNENKRAVLSAAEAMGVVSDFVPGAAPAKAAVNAATTIPLLVAAGMVKKEGTELLKEGPGLLNQLTFPVRSFFTKSGPDKYAIWLKNTDVGHRFQINLEGIEKGAKITLSDLDPFWLSYDRNLDELLANLERPISEASRSTSYYPSHIPDDVMPMVKYSTTKERLKVVGLLEDKLAEEGYVLANLSDHARKNELTGAHSVHVVKLTDDNLSDYLQRKSLSIEKLLNEPSIEVAKTRAIRSNPGRFYDAHQRSNWSSATSSYTNIYRDGMAVELSNRELKEILGQRGHLTPEDVEAVYAKAYHRIFVDKDLLSDVDKADLRKYKVAFAERHSSLKRELELTNGELARIAPPIKEAQRNLEQAEETLKHLQAAQPGLKRFGYSSETLDDLVNNAKTYIDKTKNELDELNPDQLERLTKKRFNIEVEMGGIHDFLRDDRNHIPY